MFSHLYNSKYFIIFANIGKTVSIYNETMDKSRDSQLLDNYDDLHASH
jgi:hypothetical protein